MNILTHFSILRRERRGIYPERLNKATKPPGISRIESDSIKGAAEIATAKGMTDFALYCDVSDSSLAELFERVATLEAKLFDTHTDLPMETSISKQSQLSAEEKESESIKLQLRSKKLIPVNVMSGRFQPSLEFGINIKNLTRKSIRAIKGRLVFKDLFDTEIFKVEVTINDKIKPQGSITWDGSMEFNEFMPKHVHFAGFKQEDLTVYLADEQIIFN